MQKDPVFFKEFSSGLFLDGLIFTVFFAVARILSISLSQSRIALSMAFVMGE